MTDVGEAPASGGRVRQYATNAERTRAWRERRKQEVEAAGQAAPAPAEGQSPELAVASLASVIPALRETLAAGEARIADQRRLVEDAIALLADPELVDERLESAKAESARLVTNAQATTQEARADAARARRAEEASRLAADDAAAAADAATAETARLESDLDTLRAEHADLVQRAEQDAAAAEQARADLAAATRHVQALTDELEAATSRHDDDSRRISDLTAENGRLTGEVAAQAARADAASATIKRIEEDLTSTREALETQRNTGQAQHDADMTRIAEQAADLRGITAERDQLAARLTDAAAAAEAERTRIIDAADRRVQDIRDLLGQQITQLQAGSSQPPQTT